ncbi:MAG TPA: aminopeptidase P family protein [Spirochaetes bacterium]|nr:aminopeptidase P family protein [Spirochaetota bacterium]
MNTGLTQRQKAAHDLMIKKNYNALVMANAANIQYFAGVTEPSIHACGAVIIPRAAQPELAVMWLDKEAALGAVHGINVHSYTPATQGKVVSKILDSFSAAEGPVGVDDYAMEYLGNSLKRSLPGIELADAFEAIERLRSIKSEEEIHLIRKACEISAQGMRVAKESLRPGVTELEVSALAEQHMIALGSDTMRHDTIVASGPRARLIHGFATQKKIEQGDMVAIDLGAVYRGYCSDIARTFVVGKPGGKIQSAFDSLRRAQDTVLAKLRPGVSFREIEAAVHEVTEPASHRLIGFVGHSLGLHVEELPRLESGSSSNQGSKIEKNMVVAFFQGSIKAGRNSGIRLEDTVLITGSGAELLTNYPREIFSV